MKKSFLVLGLFVLVLIVGGYFLYNYFSNPRMLNSNSESVSTCTDSDGKNIYGLGISSYVLIDGTKKGMEDICDYSQQYSKTNVGVVREGYCDGSNFKTEVWTCGYGYVCRAGKCIKGASSLPMCSDGDGGKNTKVMGSIIAADGSGTDSCWTSENKANPELDGGYGPDCNGPNCYIYEYFCDVGGNLKQHEIIACPGGCSNGVCI